MSNELLQRSEKIYALLLKLYPQSYTQEFGTEMQYVFSESLKEAYQGKGNQGVMQVLGRTFVDLTKTVITQHIQNQKQGGFMKSKSILYVAMVTAALLMIPLLGRWPWTLSDFVIMGILIFSTGSMFELVRTNVRNTTHRAILAVGVIGVGLWLWVELAVGLFTNWGS